MNVRPLLVFCVVLLLASVANGQNNPPQSAHGLAFGDGVVSTGPTGPTEGQAVCKVNGKLQGCNGGGGGGNTCTGRVTLINGVGIMTAACIKATMTICLFQDLTTFNNQVTETAPPTDGSVTVTGVNNDTVQGVCL